MAMVIIMVLVAQDAFVGPADPVPAFVIMDSTEQAFPAAAHLMSMLIIMNCVCPEQAGAAVSDLVAVLIIMIHAVRQDARTTEELFHGIDLLLKRQWSILCTPFIYSICYRSFEKQNQE